MDARSRRVLEASANLADISGSICFDLEQTARMLRKLEASATLPRAGCVQSELARVERLSFPSLQSDISMLIEDKKGRRVSHVGDTFLADSAVVSGSGGTCLRRTEADTAEQHFVDGTARRAASTVAATVLSIHRLAFVRQRYATKQIPVNMSSLQLEGNRSGTQRAYKSAWRVWCRWCGEQSGDPVEPSLTEVLSYLTFLFEHGRSYRTINLHRSMLSSTLPDIDGVNIGKHPLVCKLLKAV